MAAEVGGGLGEEAGGGAAEVAGGAADEEAGGAGAAGEVGAGEDGELAQEIARLIVNKVITRIARIKCLFNFPSFQICLVGQSPGLKCQGPIEHRNSKPTPYIQISQQAKMQLPGWG